MDRWEYACVSDWVRTGEERQGLLDRLTSDLGTRGWELVSVTPHNGEQAVICWLKRRAHDGGVGADSRDGASNTQGLSG